jgi:tripartite-type tricarboxylate transporter receptor subunit TctC
MGMRLLLCAALLIGGNALAQSWPTKAVRVIVTFSPGGSSDIVARLVAIPLQAELGQSVVVDNKPGAGGTIGAVEAAHAAPDGYTLLLSNSAPISISPAMQDEPRYDPVKSFTHVSYIGSVANVFVIHPSVPARNMPELVAWIKAQPNPVNYGSGGIGSIGHIVGETLKNDQGLRMEHVGYKGSSPMHNDLLAGTIKLAIDTLPQNVPFIKDGKLRAIAVTSPKRLASLPNVPTVAESGYPGFEAATWSGLVAPVGTPQAVIDRLNAETNKALKRPDMLAKLDEDGSTPLGGSAKQFADFLKTEHAKWGAAVREANIKLD